MGYGDEAVIADVKDGAYGQINYTDPEGNSRTYYRARSLWLSVSHLRERISIEAGKDGAEPRMVRYVTGLAEIDKDVDIAVIGLEHSKTKSVPIAIRVGEWRRDKTPEDEDAFFLLSDVSGAASVGFIAADWEIGNSNEWYIDVRTGQAVVDSLAAAIASGRASLADIGIQNFRGLYSSEHDMAPVSMRGHLYLRPDSRGRADSPRPAMGDLVSLHLQLTTPSETPSRITRDEDGDLQLTQEHVSVAPSEIHTAPPPGAHEIVAAVEKLRGTLKWLAGFVFLCFLAFANRS